MIVSQNFYKFETYLNIKPKDHFQLYSTQYCFGSGVLFEDLLKTGFFWFLNAFKDANEFIPIPPNVKTGIFCSSFEGK